MPRNKLIQISTAYFFQKLYYACPVWLPVVNNLYRRKILAASANCLRIVCKDYNRLYSYIGLHELCKRATPKMWEDYATITLVHQILYDRKPVYLYKILNSRMVFHDRSNQYYCRPNNAKKVGLNCISNRIMGLMKRIQKTDYLLSADCFKKMQRVNSCASVNNK